MPGRSSLLGRFSALSAVTLAVLALSLGALMSRALEDLVLERAREDTAQFIRQHVPVYLKGIDLSRPPADSAASRRLADHVHEISIGSHIARVKIWNPARQVIYSDNPAQTGKTFTDNEELNEALEGKVEAEISGLDKAENAGDRGGFKRLMELYVPVQSPGSTRVDAVFEVYEDLSDIDRGLARARLKVWGVLAAGMLALYFALFGIVRNASSTIDRLRREELALTEELRRKEILSSLGELSAVVAHEIKNPLSIIRGSAETLRRESPQKPEDDQLLGFIVAEVNRLNTLVGSLLDFARPRPAHRSPTDVHEAVREAARVVASPETRVQLELGARRHVLQLDPDQLRQVLINLIKNAEESLEGGGEIRVATADEGGSLVLTMDDTGHGIPEEDLEKVFLPFHTGKATGSGLGLPIARKLVEAVGGQLRLERLPGRGTRVRLVLPAGEGA